ncbi:hypothetical protein BH24ACT4_BH24ACT4_22540 [soil metagenome]
MNQPTEPTTTDRGVTDRGGTDRGGTVTLPTVLVEETVALLGVVEDWLIHTDPVALDEVDQNPPIPVTVLASHLAETADRLRTWRTP